jgi:hypothetical protein
MSLPVAANTTCDIYRSGVAPPAAPSVAGVAIVLTPDFANAHAVQTTTSTTLRWTHVLMCDLGTDIRDAYNVGGAGAGQEVVGTTMDTVYVPNKNGTAFLVLFVERIRTIGGSDYLRVYLQRQVPAWGSLGGSPAL